MPDAPVLVVDDCSADATVSWRARPAPACWRCRITWDWEDACRPAIGWRSSWDIEYVIRVDGDGQHDPRDIPKILEALEREDCEMVIGSRFVERVRSALRRVCARAGIVFFRAVLRPILGKAGARSDVRIRGREPHRAGSVFAQLSAGISRDRGAGGAAAPPFPLRRSALPDAAAADRDKAPSPR